MSRNGSGTYTVPNTFVAGQPITAASHNQNWSDAATEITNSVAADGQTSMTGALKASIGTLALPSYTFSADTDTGLYRKSSNTIAAVCGAAEVIEISSTGAAVTGDLTATGTVKQAGFALLPVGVTMGFGGVSAPSGWLLCYGQEISRTTYLALFAVIGTTYGGGNGSTTFNVPDCRGRVVASPDNMGGSDASRLTGSVIAASRNTLGGAGGEATHTMTLGELPTGITSSGSNSITVAPVGGATGIPVTTAAVNVAAASAANAAGATFPASSSASWGAVNSLSGTNSISVTSNNTSGSAHNNVQPMILLNQIIFAGV